MDDAFQDVRIHSFGYSSGLNRESVLNVRDFAKSLLCAVKDSPVIRQDGKVCVSKSVVTPYYSSYNQAEADYLSTFSLTSFSLHTAWADLLSRWHTSSAIVIQNSDL